MQFYSGKKAREMVMNHLNKKESLDLNRWRAFILRKNDTYNKVFHSKDVLIGGSEFEVLHQVCIKKIIS